MDYWRGKRAVVIGASAGLGRTLCGVLAERGARVAMVARGQPALDEAAGQLRARRGDIVTVAGDVTNQADVNRIAATILEPWGGVDIVCHCAGRSTRGDVLATTPDDFRQ